MSVPIRHPRLGIFNVVNQAIKLSRTFSSVRTPTPDQGEHTDEILLEIGYSQEDINQFRIDKAI